MTQHFYRAYGLIFQSDLPIETLVRCDRQAADVVIKCQNFDIQIADQIFTASFANWQAAENVMRLQIANVAQYLIRDGAEIWIDAAPNATRDDLTSFLISSAFAALLQQRRFLTLHASAVAGPQGAVLFIGRSGVGKSTTLAALADRGFAMVTDDIGAVSFDSSGAPEITPSFPTARLKRDAIENLGKTVEDYRQVRTDVDKFLLPVASFSEQRTPVSQIFILDVHADSRIDIEPIDRSEAFSWLLQFTFRKRFYDGMQLSDFHFAALSKLLLATQILRVNRPDYPYRLDELVQKLSEEISSPTIEHLLPVAD